MAKGTLSLPDSCKSSMVLPFPYNQPNSNCFLMEENCSAAPGKWLEIVFQFLTMAAGSQLNWGGGELRLSASLQTLLLFSSYFMIFIFPVFTVVTRLCRLPSPPPRGRITHIGASFNKDCLVGTKDSAALTPGGLDFTILFNLLKLKWGSPCTS